MTQHTLSTKIQLLIKCIKFENELSQILMFIKGYMLDLISYTFLTIRKEKILPRSPNSNGSGMF